MPQFDVFTFSNSLLFFCIGYFATLILFYNFLLPCIVGVQKLRYKLIHKSAHSVLLASGTVIQLNNFALEAVLIKDINY
jgi:hypothetical protein